MTVLDPDRPPVDITDDGIFYRASALGHCPTELTAARLGMTPTSPPATLQAAYDDGHQMEAAIMNTLIELGWHVAGAGDEQVPHFIPAGVDEFTDLPLMIAGSPDGLVSGPTGHPIFHGDLIDYPGGGILVHLGDLLEQLEPALYVADAKFLAADTFDQIRTLDALLDRFPSYGPQMSAYMLGDDWFDGDPAMYWKLHGTGQHLPGLFILARKILSDPDDPSSPKTFDAIRLIPVPEPPVPLADLIATVHKVEVQARANDLVCPENRFPCSYIYLHDGGESGEVAAPQPPVPVLSPIVPSPLPNDELVELSHDELVTRHLQLKEIEAGLDEARSQIRDRFIDLIPTDDDGKGKLDLSTATVSVGTSRTAARLTEDAKEAILRDHGCDVADYETRSTYQTVTVRKKKS